MKMSDLEKVLVNSNTHGRRVSRYADRLLEHVSTNASMRYLDVGCGNGAVPLYLAQEYGFHVTGVDVDPKQIAEAEAASNAADVYNTEFLALDASYLPLPDNHFDVVSTFRMTHHMPNWLEAMDELVRVLKPGGALIYADFVVPGWVAESGKKITGDMVGYPTAKGLDAFIARRELDVVHRAHMVSYEVVCRKPRHQ